MHRLSLSLGFILLLTSCWAQQDKVLFKTENFPSNSIKQVEVNTPGGQITVTGGAGSEATVEVFLNPNGNRRETRSTDLASIFAEEYDLTLSVQNGTLTAKAERKGRQHGNNPLSVSFNIVVPSKVDTRLQTAGGSIHLKQLDGSQSFKTAGGSLHLDGLSGIINGETAGGSITASDSKGSIDIVSAGGSIKLDNLSGTLNVRTAGGSIKGEKLSGTLTASTGGGSVELNDLSCALDANTGGGSISASLKTVSEHVNIKTGAGSINLQVPADQGYDVDLRGTRVNANNLRNFSGSQKKEAVKGQVNGGGVALTASTGSGSVNVSLR